MIKKTLILFILFFCNLVFSQKQITEKLYNTEYDDNCKEVSVNTGKPVFIVVYINNGTPNDSLLAVRELKELKKNFKTSNFYFFNKKGKIIINNKFQNILNFDVVNESYENVLYWDGKKSSEVYVSDKIVKTSEYFSEILGFESTSSYINEFNKKKDSINNQLVWEPNENSRKISEKFINELIFDQFQVLSSYGKLLNVNFQNVKRLVINTNMQGYKNPWVEIWFNENGNPTKTIFTTDDSDKKKGQVNFEYVDNLLSKVTVSYYSNGEMLKFNSNIYYSNNKLIFSDDLSVSFQELKDGLINYKSFYADTKKFTFLVDILQTNKNNELAYYESSGLNNYFFKLNAKENIFPITYISRPDTNGNSEYITTISKTSDLNYEIIKNKTPILKVNYLNKNLIKDVLYIEPEDNSNGKKIKQNKFDFNYEYFK